MVDEERMRRESSGNRLTWHKLQCGCTHPGLHPSYASSTQSSISGEGEKKRRRLVTMTTGRQCLHGTKAGRSRLCDWERERVSDVWQSRRGPPGALIHLCLAETTGALMQQRWRRRGSRRKRGAAVRGKERRGGKWKKGNWCGKRELKWCLERWRVKQRIQNKCTQGAEIFFSVIICSHLSVKRCLLKQSPGSWHSMLLKLDFTVPILAN